MLALFETTYNVKGNELETCIYLRTCLVTAGTDIPLDYGEE